jgi:hypothetical protein
MYRADPQPSDDTSTHKPSPDPYAFADAEHEPVRDADADADRDSSMETYINSTDLSSAPALYHSPEPSHVGHGAPGMHSRRGSDAPWSEESSEVLLMSPELHQGQGQGTPGARQGRFEGTAGGLPTRGMGVGGGGRSDWGRAI